MLWIFKRILIAAVLDLKAPRVLPERPDTQESQDLEVLQALQEI
jgi:hypothetical protein